MNIPVILGGLIALSMLAALAMMTLDTYAMTSMAKCLGCGRLILEDAPRPCACGDSRRAFTREISEEIRCDESLKIVQERPGFRSGGKKRPVLEAQHGWGFGGDGIRRFKERVVDRLNRRYRERVELEDGTVIRDVDEDLPEHRS